MAELRQCDRCKKVEMPTGNRIWVKVDRGAKIVDMFDICEACFGQLKLWKTTIPKPPSGDLQEL
jgi:hypothetical protein